MKYFLIALALAVIGFAAYAYFVIFPQLMVMM